MIETRTARWGSTYSGRKYYPTDPRAEDIDIQDIAQSLSNLCRFGGHVRKFYSVAEHSVLVADIVAALGGTRHEQLWGLLHDASEAYLADIPRPLKETWEMEGYRRCEERMMQAVRERFLLEEMPDIVHTADEIALATEAHQLIPEHAVAEWNLSATPWDVTLLNHSPEEAKERFLNRFHDLY